MTLPALARQVQGMAVVTADNFNTYTQCGGAVVADLRAFVGVSGMTCTIVGFSAPNDGGFGSFYWNTTAVNPVDDGGRTTIVPAGVGVGCWTRLLTQNFPGEDINITAPPYNGSGNGQTDNLGPYLAALGALPSGGGCIFFPSGKYFFSAKPSFHFPNKMFSVCLRGSAQDATILYWPNPDGGLEFIWANQENSIHFRDMSITTGATSGGSGVSLINETLFVGFQEGPQNTFTRVTLQGDTGTDASKYWTTAINVQNIDYVRFEVHIYGGAPHGTGVSLSTTGSSMDPFIAADYKFIGCDFVDLDICILTTNDPQGVIIDSCTLVDSNVGFATEVGSYAIEGVQISNSNFACTLYNFYGQTPINDLAISNTVFITNANGVTNSASILINSVAGFTITGNKFVAADDATLTTAIKVVDTTGWPGIISGNAFRGQFLVGIDAGAATSDITAYPNAYGTGSSGPVTPFIDAGTNNVFDIKDAPWIPVLKFGGLSTGITYTTRSAAYSRNGAMITASWHIVLLSKGAQTGAATLTGLPLIPGSLTSGDSNYYTAMASMSGGLSFYVDGAGVVNFTTNGATGQTAVSDANFTDTTAMICSVTYQA